MAGKTKKLSYKILITVSILAVVMFILNWFLTYRLENFLRETMRTQVAKATGGFYQLDFDKLDIGLFDGELTLDGVYFRPDTAVFDEWLVKDSLPQVYTDFTIERIHFKGVNLAWRWSYKKLNFELFEITRPVIHLFDSSNYSDRIEKGSKNVSPQRLYELISPYIDELSVRQMNLDHASVSYKTDDWDNPSVYALHDFSFHAYGFRLNKDSYDSGKLLYCDNFDFATNKPQSLLTNNQLLLNTENIRLSTQDSLIQIDKIELIPQTMLWAQTNQAPPSYVEAGINTVEVKGVAFERIDARNYLKARSFNIEKSNLKYYETKSDTSAMKMQSKGSINLSWSLYTMVSPILHKITIDTIGIKSAMLEYTTRTDDYTDWHKLDKFTFHAYDFRIDSLADMEKKFLYSDYFDVRAEGINNTIASKNHVITVGQMELDTRSGDFSIKDVKLWPLTTNTDLDYMQGSIDSVMVAGILYDKGVRAKQLDINAPVVEYVKMPAKSTDRVVLRQNDSVVSSDLMTTIDLISPFFGFLSIDRVNLNSGNITFRDNRTREKMVYRLPRIDVHATRAFVNEETIYNTNSYFAYENFEFKFEDFDNLLPGKDYRLIVKKGVYTGLHGDLLLSGVKLIPQEKLWKKSPDTYFSLSVPTVKARNVYYKLDAPTKIFSLGSFDLVSPHIQVVKARESAGAEKKKSDRISDFALNLGMLNISDAYIGYRDNVTGDTACFSTDKIGLKSLVWYSDKKLSLGDVVLNTPRLNMTKQKQAEEVAVSDNTAIGSFVRDINVDRLHITDIGVHVNEPAFGFDFETGLIDVRSIGFNKSMFEVGSVDVGKPVVKVRRMINSETIKPSVSETSDEGLFAALAAISERYAVGQFMMSDAEIDYSTTLNGQARKQQQVNSTSFDFENLSLDSKERTIRFDDFNFSTKNLNFPIDNGFYTFRIGEVDLHQKDTMLVLRGLHLDPSYPKEVFAYHHPKHKDWFDVRAESLLLSGIDYPTYFSTQVLNVKDVRLTNAELLNFKNQQIEIQHNVMPMIYENLQKAPLKLNIANAEVRNLFVQYEELSKKGTEPGKIFFAGMNGKFTGLTNVVTHPQQYIRLDADGKLMGTGHFEATWYLPVDSLNDRFLLAAKLKDFDLREMNRLVQPMAPAMVNGGRVDSLVFKAEASSLGAKVQMRFVYNGLDVALFKEKNGMQEPNKFVNGILGMVLKKNNPDKKGKRPREPYLAIERDPYHSTFNYLWQILQPPLVESVGVSQRTQNFFKGVTDFVAKVKNIFKKEKGDKAEPEPKDSE